MNIVDYLIIILIIINGFGGLIKGFIITFFSFVGFIISIIIAKTYYPVLATYLINNTNMFVKIQRFVDERLSVVLEKFSDNSIMSIEDILRLPSNMNSTVASEPVFLSNNLTYVIISIISIIIIFLLSRFAIFIIMHILDSIAQFPILKQFNRLVGLVFGIAKGILVVYIIFAMLTPVISLFPDSIIAQKTFESTLGYFFYSKNLIIGFIKTLSISKELSI